MPSCLPASCSVQMCGWFSVATTRASRSKRSRASGSLATCAGQDLDRDRAIQPRVTSFVDLAHPARSDPRLEEVRAELLPLEIPGQQVAEDGRCFKK